MEFKSLKPAITLNDLENFEKEKLIDFITSIENPRFPESFRKHILKYHGGKPEKDYLDSTGKKLHYFFTLDEIYDWLEDCYDLFPEENYIPFVSDEGGNPFCMNINPGENYGKIYFCPMDGCDSSEVIDSFEEFMNELVVEEED